MTDEMWEKIAGPPSEALKVLPTLTWLLDCGFLDEVYDRASRKVWRVGVTVNALNAPGTVPQVGFDDAMAWFPGGTVFAGECISSLLRSSILPYPQSSTVGWIQIHRDAYIWMGWGGDNNISIEWKNVTCWAGGLLARADDGRRWEIRFNIYYAGYAPSWPDWLKD